jgi:hypothetical protein
MRGFCISRIHWLADLTCHLVTTALEVTVSRGEGVVKVCHQCGGKFGLARHLYLRYSFCSRQCLQCFKQRLVERFRYERTRHPIDKKGVAYRKQAYELDHWRGSADAQPYIKRYSSSATGLQRPACDRCRALETKVRGCSFFENDACAFR